MAVIDNYIIKVDTKGAEASIKNLNTALGGLAAAFSLKEAVQFADGITSIRNKLALLSPTIAGVQKQFEGLAAISILARTPLEQTSDLYFRIARAANAMGISQQEAADITQSVAKALSATGLSAQEAAGPLLQLGQALQSGVFQGDELKSILEGMPPVATALANSLNVPVGALKKLGSEGKITSADFVKAMKAAKSSIDQDFAKALPTITQAFETVKTSASLAFNNFEQNTKTGQSFALAIEYMGFMIFKLSKNIDQVIGPLSTFIKIALSLVAFSVAGRVLGALIAALRGVWAAVIGLGGAFKSIYKTFEIFAWQIGKIWREGAVTIATFIGLGKRVKYLAEGLSVVAKGFATLGAAIATFLGLDKIGEWFSDSGKAGSEASNELAAYREELAKMAQGFDSTVGSANGMTSELYNQQEAAKKLAEERKKAFNDEVTNVARTIGAYKQANEEQLKGLQYSIDSFKLSEKEKAIVEARAELEKSYLAEITNLRQHHNEIMTKGTDAEKAQLPLIEAAMGKLTEAYNKQSAEVERLTIAYQDAQAARQLEIYTTQQQIDVQNKLQSIQDEMAKMTLPEIEQKYYDISAAARDSARAAIQAEEQRRGAALTPEEADAYYKAAMKGTDQLIRKTREHYDLSRSWSTGWKKAFNDYKDNATNAAKQAEAFFKKATQGMEDAIVDFAKTGKFEWKSFVASMLEELLRAQIQQLFARMLGGIQGSMANMTGFMPGESGGVPNFGLGDIFGGLQSVGGLIGGVVSGIGDLFGGFFANGGNLGAGKWGIAGENGPELIRGPANIVPNYALGGAPVHVTYQINAVDALSFKQMVARDPSFIHAVAMQGAKSIPGTRR